jgi:hypothetical protein
MAADESLVHLPALRSFACADFDIQSLSSTSSCVGAELAGVVLFDCKLTNLAVADRYCLVAEDYTQ